MARTLPRFDFRVDFGVASDRGAVRQQQEDAYLVAPDRALFAVADGMGGHRAGEVAARIAVDAVAESLSSKTAQRVIDKFVRQPDLQMRHAVFHRMRRAVEHANDRVRDEAASHESCAGMGSTLDVVWLARDHAFVAHAGDGRVYLARTAAVLQLTQDHAQLEALQAAGEVTAHEKPRGLNRLLNAVGIGDSIDVDTLSVDVRRGDRLLLCSDGVHGPIESEARLGDLLRCDSARNAATALVAHSLEHGRDNATAIVVEVRDRFVQRERDEMGLSTDVVERARASPLLQGLPLPSVLSALAGGVEVEVTAGQTLPRVVASDLVAYLVIDGLLRLPDHRRVGAGALLFPESLVGVEVRGDLPLVEEASRLVRFRADDFAEVCEADGRLAKALYQRLATHLARASARSGHRSDPSGG